MDHVARRLSAYAGIGAIGIATVAQASPSAGDDEVRAVVAEMLADADARSSLLTGDAGASAGHDGKFFIAGGADDGFRLNVGGIVQFRYVLNFRDSDPLVADDDFNGGFQTRRTKLITDGTIGKDWYFRVQSVFARDTGTLLLEDAYGRYSLPGGMKLLWGQFKLPLLREESIGDPFQLTAERSLTNEAFSQKWSQGVQLSYEGESIRATAAVSDGLFGQNTDYGPTAAVRENTSKFALRGKADWAVTGRVDWLVRGAWKQFQEFTSPRGSGYACLLGAAAHFQQSKDTGNPADVDRNTLEYVADLGVKGDGWNAYGEFIGRHTRLRGSIGGGTDFNDFGAIVGAGWRCSEKDELFARWDALFADGDRLGPGAPSAFHFLTAGVSHFFAGQALKLTVDAVYSFNNTSGLRTLGLLPSTSVELFGESARGEVAIRTQIQLLF